MSYYTLKLFTELLLNSLLILGVVTVIVTPWIIKARERKRIHDTLSKELAQGATPSPEFLKALTENTKPALQSVPPAQSDLRRGVFWLSAGIGIAALAVGLIWGHDPRYFHLPISNPFAALGIGAFPAAIGLGYIILWWVGRNQSE